MAIMRPPCDEAVLRSGNADIPCAPQTGRWILAATILGSSMAFIDSTVVNVALPALQSSLHATVVGVQWVVELPTDCFLESLDSSWWVARRPVWPPIDVFDCGSGNFRGCFGRLADLRRVFMRLVIARSGYKA